MSRTAEFIRETIRARETNKLKYFEPYPYQDKFIEASKDNNQILLMAGNRVGKTFAGAFVMACHLTGLYPSWWKGRKFTSPIKAWFGGQSNVKTRDVCQAMLFGEPGNPEAKGTGAVPLDCIGEMVRLPGVPNAVQSVYVKHVSGGWSSAHAKSYEMGHEAWMSESVHVVWLDEEPPQAILSQAMTRTLDKQGLTYMTFTPENGRTSVVIQFMTDIRPGQCLVTATWDDAPHLDLRMREQVLAAYPENEREMRSKGVPMLGTGLVYPVPDSEIVCDPFQIPDYYRKLIGLDMGWDHPTAAVAIAHDADTDIVYIYATYRAKNKVPVLHAEAIKGMGGDRITVVWPHDGNRRESYNGPTLADQYRRAGLRMHYQHFCNPPAPGEEEGKSGNAVEPGISAVLTRMQTGKLKVFRNLHDWWEEKRFYHREEGLIVPKMDDLMSATRYAVQSLRFASSGIERRFPTQAESKFNVWSDYG